MLLWFVLLYWAISVGIGLYAAKFVKNSKDFAVAGRQLPFYVVTATVFATWFGSEMVLGAPAKFLESGLSAVVADPFGTSSCLILVGLFFAIPLYRKNILTLGDYYKQRYGQIVEVLTTLAIVISYLGWVAAQITALGLVFHVVSGGSISELWGMILGASTILIYTFFGGMWAVAITDLIQMSIIILGLLFIGHEISGMAGGVQHVLQTAADAGKFDFWPHLDWVAVITFISAWVTMMFGSIPQQDVFQRVSSAKSEKGAALSSIVGGLFYFAFAFIPMLLAYSATLVDPGMVARVMASDSQMVLPTLILEKTPLWVQILFFGALLSAIKSCASATLLAPSVTFSENLLRPAFPHWSDQQLLKVMRWVTVGFTICVTLYAIYSDSSIFNMVEDAYQVTLVGAFIPLVCGIYWKRATNQGAIFSIVLGVSTWIGLSVWGAEDALFPPQIMGLFASAIGMILGSLTPQWISSGRVVRDEILGSEEIKEQA